MKADLTALIFSSLFLLGGTVTRANGLTISSAGDLITFSNNVNKGTSFYGTTVYLGSDIVFDSTLSKDFKPIGDNPNKFFNGTFDGQGHVIRDLTISVRSVDGKYSGLFGFSKGGATIKNLVMDGSYSIMKAGSYSGSVAGECYSCIIENIVNKGNLNLDVPSDFVVGGIVGSILSTSVIQNCVNYGSLTNIFDGNINGVMGGIVGKCGGSGSKLIQNCLSYRPIAYRGTTSNDLFIGSILGDSHSGNVDIVNCVSALVLDPMKGGFAIGFVGKSSGNEAKTEITHCFWTDGVEYKEQQGTKPPPPPPSPPPGETFIFTMNATTLNELNGYTETNGWNKWLLNTNNHTMTFKVNEYSGFSLSSQIVLLPDLSATGSNTFKGWFTSSMYSTTLTSYETAEAMTLYGLYGVVVSVTYNQDEIGSSSKFSRSLLKGKKYGTLPSVEDKIGHSFAGWFTGEGGRGELISEDATVAIAVDHTLYAHWAPNNYTITFDSNGGRECEPIIQNYGSKLELPKPTKVGYTFDFWCSDSELATEYTETTVPARNEKLYAKWTINSYTITFVFDNGKENEVRTLNFNESIVYPENPIKTGYTFNGWSPKPDTMPAENVTVAAQWIEMTKVESSSVSGISSDSTKISSSEKFSESGTSMVSSASKGSSDEKKSFENDDPVLLEIIFSKDVDKDDVERIITKFTDGTFTIEAFESNEDAGETRVIVRFIDSSKAEKFIRDVNENLEDSYVKRVGLLSSFSPFTLPFVLLSFLFV